MSLDTDDPVTHAARIYEATRLSDMTLSFNHMLETEKEE
jgi:hypothetical protein